MASSRLFPPSNELPNQNVTALKTKSLKDYYDMLPDFQTMLTELKKKEFFLELQTDINYSMKDFLHEEKIEENKYLSLSSVAILTTPLPTISPSKQVHFPETFQPLKQKIEDYIAKIIQVLDNSFSKRFYEKNIADRENVTERIHALQAGKIGFLYEMKLEDVLALLLHDIARPTIDDENHGDSKHCEEGDTILLPLGTFNYTLNHAFAKYLLTLSSELYRTTLISDVSKKSSLVQNSKLQTQIQPLNNLPPKALAKFLYKIMFMRLIDDFSKVPEHLLRVTPTKSLYFTDETITQLVKQQIYMHLARLTKKPSPTLLADYENQLDNAMELLLRPEKLLASKPMKNRG